MSQIQVFSELILQKNSFVAEMRGLVGEITSIAQQVRAVPIEIPIRADDQFTPMVRNLVAQTEGTVARLEVRAEDLVTSRINAIRTEVAENPVVVPVVYQSMGGEPGGGAEGSYGTMSDAGTRMATGGGGGGQFGGGRIVRAIAYHFAYSQARNALALNDLSGQARNAGDPEDEMRLSRELVQRNDSGILGFARRAGVTDISGTSLDQAQQAVKSAEQAERTTRELEKQVHHRIELNKHLEHETETATRRVAIGAAQTDLDRARVTYSERIADVNREFRGPSAADNLPAEHPEYYDKSGHLTPRAAALQRAEEHAAGQDLGRAVHNQWVDDRAQMRESGVSVGDIQEGQTEAMMRRQGYGSGEVNLRRRNSQIDEGIQRRLNALLESQDADPGGQTSERSKRLRAELDAAKAAAPELKAENQAEYDKKVQDDVAAHYISAHKAMLSEASKDYQEETKVFKEEWDERLKKIQDAREFSAAIQERQAQQQARDERHRREVADYSTDTTAMNLRAAGQGGLADVLELEKHVRDDLAQAGNDPQRRRAVLERGKAEAQGLASGMFRPQTFSSWMQFEGAVQQGAFSGTGSAMAQLQDFFKAMNQAEHAQGGTSDKIFQDAAKKLEDAGDKILKGGQVLILKDN